MVVNKTCDAVEVIEYKMYTGRGSPREYIIKVKKVRTWYFSNLDIWMSKINNVKLVNVKVMTWRLYRAAKWWLRGIAYGENITPLLRSYIRIHSEIVGLYIQYGHSFNCVKKPKKRQYWHSINFCFYRLVTSNRITYRIWRKQIFFRGTHLVATGLLSYLTSFQLVSGEIPHYSLIPVYLASLVLFWRWFY